METISNRVKPIKLANHNMHSMRMEAHVKFKIIFFRVMNFSSLY